MGIHDLPEPECIFWAYGPNRPSRSQAEKISAIAEDHGCTFVEHEGADGSYDTWFATPIDNEPTIRRITTELYAALDAAGLTEAAIRGARP